MHHWQKFNKNLLFIS